MKNNYMNITSDLKHLLDGYMATASAEEFIKAIEVESFAVANDALEVSEPDKSQVEYDFPKGIDYRLLLDKVITHCEKQLTVDKYYSLLLDLSELMLFAGEVAYSLEIAQNLQSKVNSDKKFASVKAETNLMISKIYWSQAYWDECKFHISEAARTFQSISSQSGVAKCENMLGTLYGEKGEFDKSRQHLENALALTNDEDYLSTHAMILTNLGIINTINGDFEKAAWNYKNAIEKFEQLNDVRRVSRIYHNLGMLYTQMGNYDSALEEFNKCITVSMDNHYLSNCAVAYVGKAYIYTKLGNPELADAYTDKAMEIAYKINDTLSIADIYRVKGMIQNDMENFHLSEELFENSIRLNNDVESKLNKAESSAEMGKLLQKTDRKEEAKNHLDAAINFYNGLKDNNLVAGLVEQSI
jgi:tetratricopeptide (TPR) repeat protein